MATRLCVATDRVSREARLAAEIMRFADQVMDELRGVVEKSQSPGKKSGDVTALWEMQSGKNVKDRIQDLSNAERPDKVETALKSLMRRIPEFLKEIDQIEEVEPEAQESPF